MEQQESGRGAENSVSSTSQHTETKYEIPKGLKQKTLYQEGRQPEQLAPPKKHKQEGNFAETISKLFLPLTALIAGIVSVLSLKWLFKNKKIEPNININPNINFTLGGASRTEPVEVPRYREPKPQPPQKKPEKKSIIKKVIIRRPTFNKEEIKEKLGELEEKYPALKQIVTQDIRMMDLKCQLAETAGYDTDALIIGETGTGKELFARAFHEATGRKGSFVPVNCGAIPKDLFESELFGHVKGAFTGAVNDKAGAFLQADGGTLFLDELGEMPLDLQSKMLRAIEYREIRPVGSEEIHEVDVRIVFATNRNLQQEVEEKTFRKDLYFRINSPCFHIPPLRERHDDIPILAYMFMMIFSERFNKTIDKMTSECISRLKNHRWEGNVRELMKVMEMMIMTADGPILKEKDLPESFQTEVQIAVGSDILADGSKISDDEIRYWMDKLEGNKSQVAKELKVSRKTIQRRCKEIGL